MTEVKKNPRTVEALPLDSQVKNEKREITNLLPGVNRTSTINKFFNASADHLFQPKKVNKFYGYVGQHPPYWDASKEFYLKEPSKTRQNYQLEPTMISTNAAGDITHTLFYDDLVNHLRFQGANVLSHSRLFEQEYYSWCPPIDLDKLTAYVNYYWISNGPDPIIVNDSTNVGVDIIGQLQYSLPNATLSDGTVVTNFALSSGMRIIFKNDANPTYNNKVYSVEAVGRGIILVLDQASSDTNWDEGPWDEEEWDLSSTSYSTPDYYVMERGAKDRNPWSTGNRWYHRDVLINTNTALLDDIVNLQAKSPIIEFERDIEIYHYGSGVIAEADVVYTGHDIYSDLSGYFVYDPNLPPDDPINEWFQYGSIGYAGQNIGSIPQLKTLDGIGIRDGLTILVTADDNPSVNNRIYRIDGIKSTGKINLVVANTLNQVVDDQVYIRYGYIYQGSLLRYTGTNWEDAPRKLGVNSPPLFQLYNIDKVKLDDPGIYPDSNFAGNRIFGFKDQSTKGPNEFNSTIGTLPVVMNQYGDVVYENYLASVSYKYNINNKTPNTIVGYKFYKRRGVTTSVDLYSNSWYQISDVLTKQYVVDEFITKTGQTEFKLSVSPDAPVQGEMPPIIVKSKNGRLEYGVDYTVTGNKLTIPTATENDFFIVHSFETGFVPTEENAVKYEIPLNLSSNPTTEDVTYLSQSQYFEHFKEIMENQSGFTGKPYSVNNYRDTAQDKSFGRTVMQHRAPLLKLMLLCSTENLDFMLSARYVEREYARIRGKINQKINEYNTDSNKATMSTEQWLDLIFNDINIGKNSTFPFYYSTMATDAPDPSGYYKPTYMPSTPSKLGVYPVYKPEYYQDETKNNLWVIRGHDGAEYIMNGPMSNGQFLDKRDEVLFALENRIYNKINVEYKGENTNQEDDPLDFRILLELQGKFRETSYSRDEILPMLRPMFDRWVSWKGFDFRKNETYDPANAFTWNYSQVPDLNGQKVPGYWRGMYRYFFDTDKPNTHPWEMLGISEKPDWWDGRYGPAPYTSGNLLLWTDLENGYIHEGPRQGINSKYARPGLSAIIPVDNYGRLLDPMQAGIIPNPPTFPQASSPWAFGDNAPVENAWTTSEYYPFAISQLAYLLKPARFIELGWDPARWKYMFPVYPTYQWINLLSLDRMKSSAYTIHGEKNADGTIFIGTGIQQWISDWVVSRGQSITTMLGLPIRNLNVRLAHKMGSFVDATNLKAVADNFGLIPQEDVQVLGHLSASVSEHVYSGAIIEWTGTGFAVYGYDILNPVFKIIPPNDKGPRTTISVGETDLPSYPQWKTRTTYTYGDDASTILYQGIVYKVSETHTSTEVFDRNKWEYIGPQVSSTGIRVTEWTEGNIYDIVESIPYGTVFPTQEDVHNFLISYQRWLEKEGWKFDQFIEPVNEFSNWRTASRDFLGWSIYPRNPGEFIALSPLATIAKFETNLGAIQSVEQVVNGVYSILDITGRRILPKDTDVSRNEGQITIEPANPNIGIFCARLFVKQFEHIFILSNTTIFQDLIYDPIFNVRQSRIKINGFKTADWTGRLDAPGFIVQSNNIYPNLDNTADSFRGYYEIEKSVELPTLREHARHIVGYQERDYFDAIITDPDVSFEFYQGMIHAKGTTQSISRFLRLMRQKTNESLTLFEEWAFRLGRYGALEETRPSIEFHIPRNQYRQNPQPITFPTITDDTFNINLFDNPYDNVVTIWTHKPVTPSSTVIKDDRWLVKPLDNEHIWSLRTSYGDQKLDLPSAGFVKINEVDWLITNVTRLEQLYKDAKASTTPIAEGSKIWSYDDGVGRFQVFRVVNPTVTVKEILQGDTTVISTNQPISTKLVSGDRIAFLTSTKSQADLEGFQTIDKVEVMVKSSVATPTIAVGDEFSINGVTITTTSTSTTVLIEAINEAAIPDVTARDSKGTLVISSIYPTALTLANVTGTPLSSLGLVAGTESDANSFTIKIKTTSGFKWYEDTSTLSVYRLEDRHIETPQDVPSTTIVGDMVWVDDGRSSQEITEGVQVYWSTLKFNGTTWDLHRREHYRVANKKGLGAVVYNKRTNVIEQWVEPYDPRKGIIPKVADKEITFRLEYDPAIYTNGPDDTVTIDKNNAWGNDMVGNLWWDISTTKYLEYEMDDVNYRSNFWGKVAPGITIDVYEWVRSEVAPNSYSSQVGKAKQDGSGDTVTGTPKGADTETYSWVENVEYNLRTGLEQTYYYYWVKNIETTPAVPFRKIPAVSVSDILQDPTSQGIVWFSPIAEDKVVVSNIGQYLVDDDTVFQIEWVTGNLDISTHSQWALMREGDENSLPDVILWNKMRDSLVGKDATGLIVPDPNLSIVEKFGTLIRPRQTWFTNPTLARQVYIEKVNSILSSTTIALDRLGWDSHLYDESAEPTTGFDHTVNDYAERNALVTNSIITTGQSVLVHAGTDTDNRWEVWHYVNNPTGDKWRITSRQQYRVEDWWDLMDWYATGFVAPLNIAPNYTFANETVFYAALPTLIFKKGTLAKILDDGNGKWYAVEFQNEDQLDPSWTKIAHQSATLSITEKLYTLSDKPTDGYSITAQNYDDRDVLIPTPTIGQTVMVLLGTRTLGWELQEYTETGWSILSSGISYPYDEFRTIITTMNENVFTSLEKNAVFFTMVNFVHSDNKMIDWAIKTSYIQLLGLEEELAQKTLLQKDLTDQFLSYIDEAKPYHTKIRNIVQTKTMPIDNSNWYVTDYDRPPYYDETLGHCRILEDGTDQSILYTRPWRDWYNEHQQHSTSIEESNIRRNKIRMYFDRIKCWSDIPLAGTNIDKIKVLSNSNPVSSVDSSFVMFTMVNSEATIGRITATVERPVSSIYTGNAEEIRFRLPKVLTDSASLKVYRNSTLIWFANQSQSVAPEDQFTLDLVRNEVVFAVPPALDDIIEVKVDESFESAPNVTGTATFKLGVTGNTELLLPSTIITNNNTLNYSVGLPVQGDTNVLLSFNRGNSVKGVVTFEIEYNLTVRTKYFDTTKLDAADRFILLYKPTDNAKKLVISKVNDGLRIKGTTPFFENVATDSTESYYRPKYKVDNISGCDFRGTIYTNRDHFGVGGYDLFPYDTSEYDNEHNDVLDPTILGGPVDFEPFYFATNIGQVDYPLPFTVSNPSNSRLVDDRRVPLVLNTDYHFTNSGNTLTFLPAFTLVQDRAYTLSDNPTFVEPPTGSGDILLEGNEFLQPNWDDNHPEELVYAKLNESMVMDVYYPGVAGCPMVLIDRISSDGFKKAYDLLQLPQGSDAVFVFVDGVFKKENVDYVLDWKLRRIVFDINGNSTVPPAGSIISVITFSAGGNRISQHTIEEGGQSVYKLRYTVPPANVMVLVNGTVSTNYTVFGDTITFTVGNEPALTDTVMLIVYDTNLIEKQKFETPSLTYTITSNPQSADQILVYVGNTLSTFTYSTLTQMITLPSLPAETVFVFVYEERKASVVDTDLFTATLNGDNTFTLSTSPQETFPPHTTVIVRKNGQRLTPQETMYVNTNPYEYEYFLPRDILSIEKSGVKVWLVDIDNYSNSIELINGTDFTFDSNPDSKSIILSQLYPTYKIAVITTDTNRDFDIVGNQVTIHNLQVNDDISITNFTFDQTYHMHTQVFLENKEGVYKLSQMPYNANYIWVSVDGKEMTYMRDYRITESRLGWDEEGWDVYNNSENGGGWDESPHFAVVHFNPAPDDSVESYKVIESRLGWDEGPWAPGEGKLLPNNSGWDSDIRYTIYQETIPSTWTPTKKVVITTAKAPPVVPSIGFKMFKDNFETWEMSRIADRYKMYLKNDYVIGDTYIDLKTNPNIPEALLPIDIIFRPQEKVPGIIWIRGERIEYWTVEDLIDPDTGRVMYRVSNLQTQSHVTSSQRFLLEDDATAQINRTAGYPADSVVIAASKNQTIPRLFTESAPDNRYGDYAISLDTFESVITANGVDSEFDLIITPSYKTMASVWHVVGSEDILITEGITITEDKVVFAIPPEVGTVLRIVQIDPDALDLQKQSNEVLRFLRSEPGTFESV